MGLMEKNNPDPSIWVKDTTPFTVHRTNLETKPENLTNFITANNKGGYLFNAVYPHPVTVVQDVLTFHIHKFHNGGK